MKTKRHCPVWGSISVKKIPQSVCSAPFGAGVSLHDAILYRSCAPNGAKPCSVWGSISVKSNVSVSCCAPNFVPYGTKLGAGDVPSYPFFFYAPKGAVSCPVWGKISVEKGNWGICSAPFGAGENAAYAFFYRYSAPIGAEKIFKN